MEEPLDAVMTIDRIVHEPSRLAILVVLDACVKADFRYLQAATGLSKSNLSLHLSKLEEHGLIEIERVFERKTPRTWARASKAGKAAMREYWSRMEKARNAKTRLSKLGRILRLKP
jgi:DNA-binding transcriptional ArsR family regulator